MACKQISELKVSMVEDDDEEIDAQDTSGEGSYPDLLYGLYRRPTKDELVDGFPIRPTADRLMSIFVSSNEPSVCEYTSIALTSGGLDLILNLPKAIVHIPTLLKNVCRTSPLSLKKKKKKRKEKAAFS